MTRNGKEPEDKWLVTSGSFSGNGVPLQFLHHLALQYHP